MMVACSFISTLHAEPPVKISESWGSIRAQASAPIPSEVSNATQAQSLARDAAIVRAQTALLTHVLQKKARSKKILAEAEIPSVDLQQHIRGTIKGARVTRTQWTADVCNVTLVLDKAMINEILRAN